MKPKQNVTVKRNHPLLTVDNLTKSTDAQWTELARGKQFIYGRLSRKQWSLRLKELYLEVQVNLASGEGVARTRNPFK